MRRNIRWITGLLLLVLLFTGCQKKEQKPNSETPEKKPLTAADIYRKAQYVILGKTPNHFVLTERVKLKATFVTAPTLHFESREEMWYANDPYALCNTISTTLNFGEHEVKTLRELYLQKEKDQTVSYIGYDEDYWVRTPIEETISEMYYDHFTYGILANIDTSLLTMEEETREVDGKEVYVLSYTIPGREKFDYLTGEEMEECLDKLEVNITLYVERETFGIVRREMTLSNITGVFSEWLYATLETDDEEIFYEDDWDFREYVLTFTELDYGKVDVPKVPEVGRQKALQNAGLGDV